MNNVTFSATRLGKIALYVLLIFSILFLISRGNRQIAAKQAAVEQRAAYRTEKATSVVPHTRETLPSFDIRYESLSINNG